MLSLLTLPVDRQVYFLVLNVLATLISPDSHHSHPHFVFWLDLSAVGRLTLQLQSLVVNWFLNFRHQLDKCSWYFCRNLKQILHPLTACLSPPVCSQLRSSPLGQVPSLNVLSCLHPFLFSYSQHH